MSNLPSHIGPYRVIRRLGVGGMAEAFAVTKKARDGSEQRFCIKRILPAFASNSDLVSAFIKEAKLISQLRHENIVQFCDFGEELNGQYLVLELVEGVDLNKVLLHLHRQKKMLPQEFFRVIAYDVAQALRHAHQSKLSDGSIGIVHRDVSPGNILIDVHGKVKLTDFGIARVGVLEAGGQEKVSHLSVVTGKVNYASPEQIQSNPIDHRSDLFSLGVVLFEVLAGKRPFDGNNHASTMLNIVQNRRGKISDFGFQVPAVVAYSIEKLLSPTPEDRFGSVENFIESMFEKAPSISVRQDLGRLVKSFSLANT